jgi:hypothetical protein
MCRDAEDDFGEPSDRQEMEDALLERQEMEDFEQVDEYFGHYGEADFDCFDG